MNGSHCFGLQYSMHTDRSHPGASIYIFAMSFVVRSLYQLLNGYHPVQQFDFLIFP